MCLILNAQEEELMRKSYTRSKVDNEECGTAQAISATCYRFVVTRHQSTVFCCCGPGKAHKNASGSQVGNSHPSVSRSDTTVILGQNN